MKCAPSNSRQRGLLGETPTTARATALFGIMVASPATDKLQVKSIADVRIVKYVQRPSPCLHASTNVKQTAQIRVVARVGSQLRPTSTGARFHPEHPDGSSAAPREVSP